MPVNWTGESVRGDPLPPLTVEHKDSDEQKSGHIRRI